MLEGTEENGLLLTASHFLVFGEKTSVATVKEPFSLPSYITEHDQIALGKTNAD